MAERRHEEPLVVPFTVLVDTRENLPFGFAGIHADAKHRRRPLVIPTRRGTIGQGDYSIDGLEDAVAIERKSLADLFSTLGQGRERFERELVRLAALRWAAVVVEADWPQIFAEPPPFSRLTPKVVLRSVIAWQQRFPNTHWWMCDSRRMAEIVTFRILERFWKDNHAQRL